MRLASGYDSVLPEAIIRGVQWYLSAETADADRIDADFAVAVETRVNESHRKAVAYMAARAELLARHNPYNGNPLETVADYEARTTLPYGALVCGAANLRKELKRAFPGVRFSVRARHGTTIDVTWVDGPTTEEVQRISGRYEDCTFDGQEDISRHTPSAFTDLFGGARYVCESRGMSTATEAACSPWYDEMQAAGSIFVQGRWRKNAIWAIVAHTSIPAGARVTGVERIPDVQGGGSVADFYRLTFAD